MVKSNSTEPLKLETGAEGVVGHAGLWQMGRFVDHLGVGALWSQAFEPPGRGGRRHDRGRMLVQAALMLTGGGEACTDIEHLRAQPGLFGDVASDSTLYRLLLSIGDDTAGLLARGLAAVRAGLWNQLTDATEVVLDIDSSVHEIHSDNKQAAARSYKSVYGFHPIYCFWDDTGECLSVLLRPGNASANKISDHTAVLDEALAALPEHAKAGGVRIRVDSAGSRGLAWECRQRGVGFSMGASKTSGIQEAISHLDTDALAWEPALPAEPGGETEAQVAEATHLVDDSEWPPGTRLIIRRERRHPGAPAEPVPLRRVPLLGPPDRPDLHPGRSRPRHARPLPGRAAHRPPQRLRRQTVPVQGARRQPNLADARRPRRRPGHLVPAALPQRHPPGAGPTQNHALGILAHPRPDHPPRPPPDPADPPRLARCPSLIPRPPAHPQTVNPPTPPRPV